MAFPTQPQHRADGEKPSLSAGDEKVPFAYSNAAGKTEIAPLYALVVLAGVKESDPRTTNPKGLEITAQGNRQPEARGVGLTASVGFTRV